MSERAEDDVRGEQRRAARQQLKQQQIQRGEGSTAMATVAERRSLPSPEIMPGQPWSSWVDAAKLHVHDGAESEESFKDLGKNREAMRLCREDMPIFGQCPAQDEFYLVMCSHCGHVVKPQAFQAHYERRHSSTSKPVSTLPFSVSSRNRSAGSGLGSGLGSGTVAGVTSGGILNRPSTAGSSLSSSSSTSSNPKFPKSAKDKLQGIQRRPPLAPFRGAQPDKTLTPAVKVEKMHLKVDSSAKLVQTPSAPATTSSSSSTSSNTTVSFNTATIATSSSSSSSSVLKPGLNCPSIPKPPLLASGQIPDGKSLLTDKKQDSSSSASSRRHCNKKVSEREFNPDIHCGVMDAAARKPCTRSLTCKTHSLSHRRAVPGRRKRFDILLAEHKNRARDRDRDLNQSHSQQNAPLRDPHPSPQLAPGHDAHQVAHGNGPAPDTTKPLPLGKPKFHSPGLPRVNSSHAGGSSGDPAVVHESLHHAQATHDGFSRPSSDEGENEEREDNAEKLDCLYSGYHPRPAAYCTFGSRLFGRGFYSFDRRWDRVRCALTTMMEKHVNSQMWKKIPLALENSFSVAPTHRTSTNSHGSTPSSGFLGPPATLPQTPYEGKSALSYGTTLNAHSSLQGGAEHPAYGTTQARQVSSSPQMPSAHLSSSSSSSSAPSLASGRTLKSRSSSSSSTTKSSSSFRPKETSSGSSTPIIPNSASGGSTGANSSTTSFSSGKKRKNSSILSSSHASSESSSSNANFSSSSSFKKNCANVGSSGSTYHHSSLGLSSSLSFSHSGVHSVGLNCGPNVRTNSLSLKAEPSGSSAGGSSGPPARGPPSGSPAESIKRMSVVMNSSDSTLSLGPFVHHQSSSDHHASFSHHSSDGRLEGKKRKSSSASSGINNVGGGGGLGGAAGGAGGTGPGRPKVAKSPAINNIHGKHGRSLPGAPGLPNNSHLHQPKARP
ncbi:ataxin-7 [Kryptolebias marmoratus]|uniref:Ataxin 7 n=1 Tax=Kryptolebias marmoratus TaxID=37003 RepID=A0A3Q3FIM2_KRYMA|nr:ataxin-7 [Kryptolebias marmoratus]XP_037831102.1 ataxin-7 [Kryptolebias marmoratus]XP_037831103.1 ataxin-7 [Kryptolebias marmoratus]